MITQDDKDTSKYQSQCDTLTEEVAHALLCIIGI